MIITTKPNSQPKNRPLIIALSVFGGIIFIIIGYLIFLSVSNKADQTKFDTLNVQAQSIYDTLKIQSTEDDWKYTKSCDEEYAGPWPTGNYHCTTLIYLNKQITSVEEMNALHEKYYPIIDSSKNLKKISELDLQNPNDFGKKFVISSAEKHYENTKTKIPCTYLAKINQSAENYSVSSYSYGSQISGDIGSMRISLECRDSALNKWYNPDL